MTSKHASSGPSLLARLLARFSPEQRLFLERLGEQVAVTFGAAFGASFEATGGSFSKAAIGAALGAGVHAVYGMWAKSHGASGRPSVK